MIKIFTIIKFYTKIALEAFLDLKLSFDDESAAREASDDLRSMGYDPMFPSHLTQGISY